MVTRLKKNLVVACLAVMIVWPAVHRALAARYGIDPWSFFGWAMYAVPPAYVELEVLFRGSDGVERPARLSRELHRLKNRTAHSLATWGELAAPDDLGRALLAAMRPDVRGVIIVERRYHLDGDTATMRIRARRHAYARR